MSEEEDQYVVENVTRARVAKKPGKGKRLYWQYRVKWKGYDKPEDDTWEPTESFEGSEHFLEQFWQRASRKLEGRDVADMSLFKVGEEFFPMGPPPRRPKRKNTEFEEQSSPADSKQSHQIPKSNKRSRTSPPVSSDQQRAEHPRAASSSKPAAKRTPSTTRSRQTTSNLLPDPSPSRPSSRDPPLPFSEIVPPSDDEYDSSGSQVDPSNDVAASEKPPRYRKQGKHRNPSDEAVLDVGNSTQSIPQAHSDLTRASMPAHRERATNPLVKMMDEFKDMDGAISIKARLSGKVTNNSPAALSTGQSPRKQKPGPGRSSAGFLNKPTSSLLTVQKGELKSVKGKYVATSEVVRRDAESTEEASNDAILDLGNWNSIPVNANEVPLHVSAIEPSIAPPTSHQLLQMAGLDARAAEDLQDFEEGAPDSHLDPQETSSGSGSLLQQSLALAKDSLFPASWSAVSIGNAMSAAWKKSTIFGPLGSASDAHAGSDNVTEFAQTSPFILTLDVTVTVPVVLTDFSSAPSSSLDSIVRNAPKGPPGKFYAKEAALSVLDTLRTGGPSARVLIAPNASETQIHDFGKLKGKLSKDELFVIIVGTEVLAFCSSDSALISQRLNFPASLTSLPGSVLVGQVTIENHSAYANAAVEVDSARW